MMDFREWRTRAREYLKAGIRPADAIWTANKAQHSLFGDEPAKPQHGADKPSLKFTVPPKFLDFAEDVAAHRSEERWALLYHALWRITHGEPHLLELSADELVRKLALMRKAVRRDAHKAKAFVRFRKVEEEDGEHYIAWHQPDHYILPIVAPFFARRFAVMKWSILTPDASVFWDGQQLEFGEGVARDAAPDGDVLEDLWKAYYRSTFNPARIKLKMMRQEMPERYWHTMPETAIIKDMLNEAPERVRTMIANSEGFEMSAADFLPQTQTIASLREAASKCQACPLYKGTTCTVFGEGAEDARLMIVGEQPGDQEDLAGRPFVGPAGKVINDAMKEAEIERIKAYMTNAVKHFKHDKVGLERYHRTPTQREVKACNAWLQAEVKTVKPEVIVALGVTAGRALFGPGFSLKTYHGKTHEMPDGTKIITSYHPAAILRMPDPEKREELRQTLVQDLKRAGELLHKKAAA
ncbi:MAG: uracil-DNA glycosylase [Micavibrio aeruginosavorus]|uniref:Type-4 uracil-DNA glycosylase n=1 Tax=Micavibrio aeruginosavorus TaxID=349221 RepID=A0A2W5C3T7_9BACT|nr:MAG: uracil-DNA glycosylase [Micavibrio aeruginosavorus]